MGIIIQYTNKDEYVIKQFLAMVHVLNTSTILLKNAVDCLFLKHGLSLLMLKGEGYDGSSNIRCNKGTYQKIKFICKVRSLFR